MSAARTHDREASEQPKGHPFRNALVVSIVLAALIMWQLTPIIHGLHFLESFLTRVEGPRRIIVGLLNTGYHKLSSLVSPVIQQVQVHH